MIGRMIAVAQLLMALILLLLALWSAFNRKCGAQPDSD